MALPFLQPGMFMHSTRHTVETELSDAGVPRKLRNDLLGHVNESEGEGRYGKQARLHQLAKVVAAIPVVMAHLRPQPIRLAPVRTTGPSRSGAGTVQRPRLVWDADRDPPRDFD